MNKHSDMTRQWRRGEDGLRLPVPTNGSAQSSLQNRYYSTPQQTWSWQRARLKHRYAWVAAGLLILLCWSGFGVEPQTPGPPAESAKPVNVEALQADLRKHIQRQRTGWSEERCRMLADYIASELQTSLKDRLTETLSHSISASVEFDVENFLGVCRSDDVAKAHYKWAISDLAARQSPVGDTVAFKAMIENSFSTLEKWYKSTHGKDYTAKPQDRADAMEYALNACKDPLYPGAKETVPDQVVDGYIKDVLKWDDPESESSGLPGISNEMSATNIHTRVRGAAKETQMPLYQLLAGRLVSYNLKLSKEYERVISEATSKRKSSEQKTDAGADFKKSFLKKHYED